MKQSLPSVNSASPIFADGVHARERLTPFDDMGAMSAIAAKPVRVLLVEDDEDDVVLTRRMFSDIEAARFEVDWAPDYEQGMRGLFSGRYDVCLVDYRLGGYDGVEFVREAASRQSVAPVILLTGQGDRMVDVAAMNAGAADFLNKTDLRATDLDRSIRYAMQHQRMQEQRLRLVIERAGRERAEAANKAKDEFLAALSHELRTPLTPVLMAVAALDQETGLPAQVREAVAMIRRNVELEARLIDDLLDLTRVANRKLELHRSVVDVNAALRHAVETVGQDQALAKRLDVRIDAAAPHAHVVGDSARLQQVFWNVIKNAVKFTPEGGRIEVRSYNESGEDDASHALTVEVKDSGIGIAPEALPRIFNAFEQTGQSITRQFGGLGLGLAISKTLVELHGGTIQAGSEGRDQGATFMIRFPSTVRPAAPLPSTEPTAAQERTYGRILLVEDHADTRRLMTRLLERQGHCVSAAESVATALATAEGARYDLVISDIGLPDGSGLDLMRKLRERGPVTGIALSGYGMEQDIHRSEAAGFAEHLTKPVDLTRLQDAVARLLAGAHRGTSEA